MITQTSVSLDDARRLIAAAEAKAIAIGSPSNIAVVDVGGNLVAHVRMDESQIASISHSINKAFTSLACRVATRELATDAQPGGRFYGIANSVDNRIVTFAGGMPLFVGSHIVGAIGVSGGTDTQDHSIAEAALAAL